LFVGVKAHRLFVALWIALTGIIAAGQGRSTPPTDDGRGETSQERSAPVTREQVRAVLNPDEPDYGSAARLGPGALPYLEEMTAGADASLAAKAVYAASLIRDRRSAAVVRSGSANRRAEVRVASAAAAGNLTREAGTDILTDLLGDSDSGVRETALKTIKPAITGSAPPASALTRVRNMAATDPQAYIRDLARQILNQVR